MGYELRNIKCTFVVDTLSSLFLSKFDKRKHNRILRMKQSIILTIYPSSSNRVHATGIKNMNNLRSIKSLFKICNITIQDIRIDNTYWLNKPHEIVNFTEFALFCQKNKKNMDIDIDLTSFAMNADGYLNSIYLKHKKANGTVIIHRKCIALLGAKNFASVKLLTKKAEVLFQQYNLFLKTKNLSD